MDKEELIKKIDHSINLLWKGENLALKMQPEIGYYLAFSGGKDSQVLLSLAEKAGVKFRPYHNVTTIDSATTIRFIKSEYPQVEFQLPKKSFIKMVEEKGLPTRKIRWCCEYYKEKVGTGCTVLTGVRAAESPKRAKYSEAMRHSRRKEVRKAINLDEMINNGFQCVHGRDRYMIMPIFNWTSEDVWEYIKMENLPVNPEYAREKRVGCIYCPMAPTKCLERALAERPKQAEALLRALQKYIDKYSSRITFSTADEYLQWWLSKDSVENYLRKKQQMKMNL